MTAEVRATEILQGGSGDRYHRQTLVAWWDQDKVASARVLVVGAGALGNEILKLLALMGVGNVLVYDMDVIERSNLSRGVLFRDEDEGRAKAETVVGRLQDLNRDVTAVARVENVVHRAGLGVFVWADVVICGVDNREARIFVNGACALAGRMWVDGAIEGFSGTVRVFDPRGGACYECTMNEMDRRLVAQRRSCALLARDVVAEGHVPSTAVAASIIGALQVQEALKVLHGQPALIGEGLHIDGLWSEISRVRYPRRDDCPGHDHSGPIVRLGLGMADATLGELLQRAEAELGDGAALDLSRDVVLELICPGCGVRSPARAVLGEIREAQVRCSACGTHRTTEIVTSVSRDVPMDLSLTPADLGLPWFDVLVARQGMGEQRAWLFDGDVSRVLGPLAGSFDQGGWRD